MAVVRRTLEEIKERAARKRPSLDPWPDEKIRAAAASDPDTWLPSDEALKRFAPASGKASRIENALSDGERKFDRKDKE